MRNFKTVACMVLKICYALKSLTNGQMNAPEAICPSNFFKVGGIKTIFTPYILYLVPVQSLQNSYCFNQT